MNSMVTVLLSKNCKSFSFDEIWKSTQIEDPEFNGDNIFGDSWRLSILIPVDISTCRYWHQSILAQFWTKNGKSSNFGEILYFTQTEGGEFKGDNSFLWFLMPVNIGNSQYWYLLSFRPQFLTKNSKCFSFDEILYFTQSERDEFNGFDIERCKWVPQRIKTWNRKTNLASKIILLNYKQNW